MFLWPTGVVQMFTGAVDDGYNGLLAWVWLVCAISTIGLVVMTWIALRERYYSAVMAATGLLYLAILTGFGMDLIPRAVLLLTQVLATIGDRSGRHRRQNLVPVVVVAPGRYRHATSPRSGGEAVQELLKLAATQYGLFSRAQAHDHGVSDRMLQRRVRGGVLDQLGASVYRVAGAPPSWHQGCWAAASAAVRYALRRIGRPQCSTGSTGSSPESSRSRCPAGCGIGGAASSSINHWISHRAMSPRLTRSR